MRYIAREESTYMGGLNSGRKRQHTCINDCLPIDTARLRKDKVLAQDSPVVFTLEWGMTAHTNFIKKTEHRHAMSALYTPGDDPTLTLSWEATTTLPSGEKKSSKRMQEVHLVTTPCNYGGVRWWFLCPSCNRRARLVYFNTKARAPEWATIECRECLEIHYASQMASYIDRHKTYERHLLANYGLYWAAYRYDYELKEHYLEMTPELWALRLKSVIDWNTHLMKEFIRCDLLFLRTDLANLRRIRSEEDRQVYLAHMRKRERELHTSNVIRLLQKAIQCERLIYEINTMAMPDDILSTYSLLADVREKLHSIEEAPHRDEMESTKGKIITLEKILRQVNKHERKAA
jgi:hypothetical protein